MKTIIALEKLIKTLEVSISIGKAKLLKHESGEEKLTLMVQASIENNLQINEPLLEKYQILLNELLKFEDSESNKKEKLLTTIDRKKHYQNNKPHYPEDKIKLNDKKIEVTMVMDELPDDTILEIKELFQMALKSIEHYLYFDIQEDDLSSIKKEFDLLLKDLTDENIKDLEMFNYMVPIIVLHFKLLAENIASNTPEPKENSNLKEDSEPDIIPFNGFPKYQDWWISELWTNHHAYFCLFRWKKEICNLCNSTEQKDGWNLIFHNWMLVKVLLFEKGEMAFEYNFAFDTLMEKFANLTDELDVKQLGITQKEIEEFLKNEDLFSLKEEHHVLTPYLRFKMDNIRE